MAVHFLHHQVHAGTEILGDRRREYVVGQVVGHHRFVRGAQPHRGRVVFHDDDLLHGGDVAAFVCEFRQFLFDEFTGAHPRQRHETGRLGEGDGTSALVGHHQRGIHHGGVASEVDGVQPRTDHRDKVVDDLDGLGQGILAPHAIGDDPLTLDGVVAWTAPREDGGGEVDDKVFVDLVTTLREERLVGHGGRGRLRGQRGDGGDAFARGRFVLRLGQELGQQAVAFAVHIVVGRVSAWRTQRWRVCGLRVVVAGPWLLASRNFKGVANAVFVEVEVTVSVAVVESRRVAVDGVFTEVVVGRLCVGVEVAGLGVKAVAELQAKRVAL